MDLGDVLDVVAKLQQAAPAPGRLPVEALEAVRGLVPCDVVSFVDLEPRTTRFLADVETDGTSVSVHGPSPSDPDEPFWRHYWSSEPCSHPSRSGDDRSVVQIADFLTQRAWRSSPMYVDLLGAWEVDHELLCPLPSVGGRSRRVLLSRSGDTAFSERERQVLALLRPHLSELLDSAAVPDAVTDLTERQQEVLRLVAEGRTNAEIAAALFLSPHTVRKHLENAFERLGVTTRTAAVARAFA